MILTTHSAESSSSLKISPSTFEHSSADIRHKKFLPKKSKAFLVGLDMLFKNPVGYVRKKKTLTHRYKTCEIVKSIAANFR